jgi:hypothetical protein
MRILFLFLGLIFLCPHRAHAIGLTTYGCQNGNGGTGATVSCTASNTAGRAQIVAARWCDNSACTLSTASDTYTISDTEGNTYGQCVRHDTANGTDRRALVVCIAENISTNASNVVTLSVTSGNTVYVAGLMASEVGGVTATVTLDQQGILDGSTAASSPISVTTSGQTTATNEMVYGFFNIASGGVATLTQGTGYSNNRQIALDSKDEWTTAVNEETPTAAMTYSGSYQQSAILVTYKTAPLAVGTYYMSPTGSDANNGTSPSTPWYTPGHPMTCGSTIIAASSAAYSYLELGQGQWGAVTCTGAPNVVWVTCATFDTCKMTASGGNPGLYVDQSYWGVQGFEVSVTANTYAGCFYAVPNSGTNIPVHHIIFANDIANGCYAGGLGTGISSTGSSDYVAIIGSIAYNADAGTYCYSNINVYEPIPYDTQPGTHIYIAGNFSFGGQNTPNCNSGFPATDGEGINIDTLDGDQSSVGPYTQQVVVDNNILVDNGGRGIEVENNSICSPCAHVYIRHNTMWGNSTDNTQTGNPCAEQQLTNAYNVEVYDNLAVPTVNTSCNGQTVYAYQVTTSPTSTTHVYNNWGYSSFGNNSNASGSTGFTFGPNNTFGTNPSFAAPANPSAPNCSSFSSVPACMATLIANFKPTDAAAKAYGYQAPSSTSIYDPLYPQWLCSVTNLPTGLVTSGCLTASALSGATMLGATIH